MQMPGKRPQHLVRLAFGVQRRRQAHMEPTDALADGVSAPFRPVAA